MILGVRGTENHAADLIGRYKRQQHAVPGSQPGACFHLSTTQLARQLYELRLMAAGTSFECPVRRFVAGALAGSRPDLGAH